MNKFIFSGNLGRDCEVSSTKKGTSVCSFSVAVKSGYGDNESNQWIRVAMFGRRAEGGLPQYLVKGQKVLVTGELTLREYQKKDGTFGASIEVMADDIELIGAKEDRQQQLSPPPVSQPQPAQPAPKVGGAMFPPPEDLDSDEIPF